jgi:hypothetical protein
MRSWLDLKKHDMAPVVSVEKASLKGILFATLVLLRIKTSVKNKKKVRVFFLLFDEMLCSGKEKE